MHAHSHLSQVRMLSGAGAVVSSAKDGREAVVLFKTAPFDVVVTDIQVGVLPDTHCHPLLVRR